MINGAGNLCGRKLARVHASVSLHRRSNPHAQFEIEGIWAHLEMVRENGANRLHALRGEDRHQFADGGAEHLHHLSTCNGETNDGSRVGLSLNDLGCLDHVVLLLSRSSPACIQSVSLATQNSRMRSEMLSAGVASRSKAAETCMSWCPRER